MSTPNDLVKNEGETVLIHRPVVEHDEFGQSEVYYKEGEEVKVIASNPNKTDEMGREGRVEMGDLTLTVLSGLDISNNRDGKPDVIERNGKTFEVAEVRDEKHPLMGIEKKTIVLKETERYD